MKYDTFTVNSETIIIPLPESYADCLALAKSDYYRYYGRSCSIFKLIFSQNTGLRYSFWLRLASYNGLFRVICKVRLRLLSIKLGIQIPSSTKIGYGLYIGHAVGIVVNPTCIIGNNCSISQFLSIGSNSHSAASIGNNVYIGPNVCIVGNVHIGSDSTIGAGAVVIRNVLHNSTVAGVPAKEISKKDHSDYIVNAFPITL